MSETTQTTTQTTTTITPVEKKEVVPEKTPLAEKAASDPEKVTKLEAQQAEIIEQQKVEGHHVDGDLQRAIDLLRTAARFAKEKGLTFAAGLERHIQEKEQKKQEEDKAARKDAGDFYASQKK